MEGKIHYDDLTGRWYAYQSVEVDDQPWRTTSRKAFVDLGVINIITAWIEGEMQAIAFSGKPLLADWWYWSEKIAEFQSAAKEVNNRDTTKRIRKYYRKRKSRFRHAINTMIFRFVEYCHEKGVGEIVVGDVKGIRENSNKNSKANSMIHNFWSFGYIIDRLTTTAENLGIKVRLVKEHYTSSYCPFCGSKGRRITRGLFYCPGCDQIMNADVVGVLNIARRDGIIPNPSWRGRDNGVLTHPVHILVRSEAEGYAQTPPGILAL